MKSNKNYAQTIILEDGRKLRYAEFGDSKGIPVFYLYLSNYRSC